MSGPFLVQSARPEDNLAVFGQHTYKTKLYADLCSQHDKLSSDAAPYTIGAIILVALPILFGEYLIAAGVAIVCYVILSNTKNMKASIRVSEALRVEGLVMQDIANSVRDYLDAKKKEYIALESDPEAKQKLETMEKETGSLIGHCISIRFVAKSVIGTDVLTGLPQASKELRDVWQPGYFKALAEAAKDLEDTASRISMAVLNRPIATGFARIGLALSPLLTTGVGGN